MKLYYLPSAEVVCYFASLDEVRKEARHIAANSYHDVEVEQVEVSTDKANILRLANNSGGTHIPLRTVYVAKARLKRTA